MWPKQIGGIGVRAEVLRTEARKATALGEPAHDGGEDGR